MADCTLLRDAEISSMATKNPRPRLVGVALSLDLPVQGRSVAALALLQFHCLPSQLEKGSFSVETIVIITEMLNVS